MQHHRRADSTLRGAAALSVVALMVLAPAPPIARSGAAAGRGDAPVLIDSYGFWSLARLNIGSIAFPRTTDKATRSSSYALPAGAHQGRSNWYVIRLHMLLTFGGSTGRAYVTVAHNGFVSALLEFDARKTATGRQVVRRSVSYIDGSSLQTVHGDTSEFRFRNYLQYKGVQGGVNELTIALEVHGSLTIESAKVFSDTGIEYSRKAPARIRLGVSLASGRLHLLRTGSLAVTVRNVGDRLFRNVSVSITVERPPRAMRILGSSRRVVGDLPPGVTRRRTFRVVPLRRGYVQISLSAGGSGGNQPTLMRTLPVG